MAIRDIERLKNQGLYTARTITRTQATMFYFASHFLPREKQNATYSIYAICRISDDAVDAPTKKPQESLAKVRARIDAAYRSNTDTDGLLLLFKETIQRYAIPQHYFDELLSGMEMDLTKARYETFEELYDYCYKVAGVVGLIMLKILGHDNNDAETHAIELGIAMQLTNMLRDIKEDFQRGRIYLPQKEMERFSVTRDTITHEVVDHNFIELMKFQMRRAREFYQKSTVGIARIHDSRSRLVVHLMKNIYAAILDAIEQNHYDVFSQRASVSFPKKLSIAFTIFLKGAQQ